MVSYIANFLTFQILQNQEYHARGLVSTTHVKRSSLKIGKRKLFTFLQGKSTIREFFSHH